MQLFMVRKDWTTISVSLGNGCITKLNAPFMVKLEYNSYAERPNATAPQKAQIFHLLLDPISSTHSVTGAVYVCVLH